ncbi:MAG: family 4 glycosyl hydrolase [Candidatus Bipolaricaulaceae bacterium]
MIKIAIIGAGSIVFSGRLVSDLVLAGRDLPGAQVVLMDIDRSRLEVVERLARDYAREKRAKLEFVATTSREAALRGADFVINVAFVPGYRHMEAEREIAERHGYYRGIGDRVSDYYGGIGAYAQLQFLRELAGDMEELCPGAWLLQTANPVLEGTTLIGRETSLKVVGMCHGHQRVWEIMRTLGLPEEEVDVQVGGLNHCIWLTRFQHHGEDAYPLLDQWFRTRAQQFWSDEEYLFDPRNYQMSPGAFALYHLFGLFPVGDTVRAVSPWWFHVDLDAQKRWFPAGGVDSEIGWTCRLSRNIEQWRRLESAVHRGHPDFGTLFQNTLSGEPHIPFVNAVVNAKPTRIVLNVPNQNVLPGIPSDVWVEVPCLVRGEEIQPERVEALPRRLMLHVIIPRWLRMERVLQAFQEGDRMGLVLEVAADHRTQSFAQAVQLVEELLAQPWNEKAQQHYRGPSEAWDFLIWGGEFHKR